MVTMGALVSVMSVMRTGMTSSGTMGVGSGVGIREGPWGSFAPSM